MDKASTDREVAALNTFRKTLNKPFNCEFCEGKGRQYSAIYGDPNLGYTDSGKCLHCNGTGTEKLQHCRRYVK